MRRDLPALILVAAIMPWCAEAVDSETFRVRSTADLVEICSVPPSDSLYAAAMGFCQGYGWGRSTITRLPLLDLGASRSFASPFLPHRVQRRYRCFSAGPEKIRNIWVSRRWNHYFGGWWLNSLAPHDAGTLSAGRSSDRLDPRGRARRVRSEGLTMQKLTIGLIGMVLIAVGGCAGLNQTE